MEDIKKVLENEKFKLLADPDWRLSNLYYIKNKQGKEVLFQPNWAQQQLMDPHYLNIVLKARQLGITTYHAIKFLDTCLFNRNINAAIIADTFPVAKEIFTDKVKYAYDRLPTFIKALSPAYRDNQAELRFRNGSVYRISTTPRGGTLNLLHITEFAKVCQENPRKANEIISGALNTIESGQFACIESTARGREGHFFEMVKNAKALQDSGKSYTPLDWKLWFFPWYLEPSYSMRHKDVIIPNDLQKYFEKLANQGIVTTPGQQAWYCKKSITQGEYMKREFPSTVDEAFEAANEGYYFAKYMTAARHDRRICRVPYDEYAKTYTAWDIGISDHTAIWVFQVVGNEVRFIDYYENRDEALPHYLRWLKNRPYSYDLHVLPHDASNRHSGTGKSYAQLAQEAGHPVTVLKKDQNELYGIECARHMFARCQFDEERTLEGIKSLEAFRKEWNDKIGCYREKSLHNWSSHGSKAFIYACEWVEQHTGNKGMSAEQWAKLRQSFL